MMTNVMATPMTVRRMKIQQRRQSESSPLKVEMTFLITIHLTQPIYEIIIPMLIVLHSILGSLAKKIGAMRYTSLGRSGI